MLLSQSLIVKADDTEDLLNVYGLTLGDNTKSEIEQEIEEIMKEINNTSSVQSDVDTYNGVLETFLKEKEQKIEDTKDLIISYTKKNETIISSLESNLLSGDIDDILVQDATIKRNEKAIEEFFNNLDYYTYDYSFKNFQSDISGLNDKLQNAQQVYIDALDTYNLGDVKNANFVLNRKRSVLYKYGYRVNPKTNSDIRFHSGTDYSCEIGSEVYALFNGEVISTGTSKVIGKFVSIQSGDNIKYLLCHLSEVEVKIGDQVKQGSLIGLSGDTGSQCTEPSVHLSLYINGNSYDPDLLFSKSERNK